MAYTEFYVQTTGSNLNAGSTTGNSAAFTYAGGTFVRSTGVFTVASGDPASDGVAVGDWASVYTTSGATQPGLVGRVTARDSTTITVSTTVLAGATANVSESGGAATLKIGGAWAGTSAGVSFPFNFVTSALLDASSNPTRVNIKGGTTYNITAAITHANNGPITWEGYTTSPGDGGLAKFHGDSASPTAPYVMLTCSGTGNIWRNLWFDDNGGTTAGQSVGNNTMVDMTGTANQLFRCRFTNAYRSGLRIAAGGAHIVECEAHSCQRDDANALGAFHTLEESFWLRCVAHSNTSGTDSTGFLIGADSTEPVIFVECIAYNNGAHGWETTGNHNSVFLYRCLAVDNVNGFHISGAVATTSVIQMESCIFYSNTTYGVSTQNSDHRSAPNMRNCAFGGNGTADTDNVNASLLSGAIALSADPFVDRVNGDFRLNDTASAGAACQGVGRGAYLIDTAILTSGASSASAPDVGACQVVLPTAAAIAADVWAYASRTLTA